MKGKKTGGRIKGAKNKATAEIKDIIDKCVNFDEVIGKLVQLVNGVEVQKSGINGPVIYTEKPDAYAARILLEYRFGKPKQSIELDAPKDTSIIITRKVIGIKP